MKAFWNTRYRETKFAYGIAPNEFLVSESPHIPMGQVLCLAEGEGRNAAYLAKKGYTITAVDQSEVGLEKAKTLAKKKGVFIETVCADLQNFEIAPASWDGVVSISAHLPPLIRKRIHKQVVQGLKPGGVFILEAYTEKQLQMAGVGGPPENQKELFMSLFSLKEELVGVEFLLARETERDFNEGKYHQGPSAVVQLVAKKP